VRDRAVLPFGVPEIDDRLPGGGLALASLHEVCGGGTMLSRGRPPCSLPPVLPREPGGRCSGA
jgi:hypothetical protein